MAIKTLDRAKTRLRGVSVAHERLALAIATDTVGTAISARAVRELLVVTSDERVARAVGELGARIVADPGGGLNAALEHGFATLRARDAESVIGVLAADLPALRTAELDSVLAGYAGTRAYCADRHGTGTTLLLTATGGPLQPRFGPGSAGAHERGGAKPVEGALPGLRTDVDTPADLALARRLGIGEHTANAHDEC